MRVSYQRGTVLPSLRSLSRRPEPRPMSAPTPDPTPDQTPAPMTEDQILAFCDGLPGAARSQPFGPGTDVWKVGDKIFALMAPGSGRVSLKCADPGFAEMLISVGRAGKAPYLPRGGWIALETARHDPEEMAHRLRESYDTVRASLPRRVQATLD